jgi:hypothetical protein
MGLKRRRPVTRSLSGLYTQPLPRCYTVVTLCCYTKLLHRCHTAVTLLRYKGLRGDDGTQKQLLTVRAETQCYTVVVYTVVTLLCYTTAKTCTSYTTSCYIVVTLTGMAV